MDKVAIVILNYLNYKDTMECVESIALDQYPAKEIIIVDNGSPNDSQARLEEKFRNHGGVHLLFSEKNEGFARGNNLGIRYARDILGCNFVLLLNNDTVVKDAGMITTLMEAYAPGVGVLGPRILAADGHEQNPARADYDVIRSALQQDLYYWRKITTIRFRQSSLYQGLKRMNIFQKKKKKSGEITRNKLAANSIASLNLILHGACFLLTPDYFKYYPFLFPGTFLYYEEDILTILTRKVGLTKKFVHTTYVFHKEHQSMKISIDQDKGQKSKYYIDSLKAAKKIYPMDYATLTKVYFQF